MNSAQKLTFLISICSILATVHSAECVKSQWCMACNQTTENKCDACFNWADSFNLPRALNTSVSPQNCVTPLSVTISGCHYYSGTTTTTASSRAIDTCLKCDRNYLRWNSVSNTAYCNDTLPFGHKHIENCVTQVFYETSTNITTGCRLCKKNWSGSGWDSIN